ncbi:MAG: DNA mismatch repair endonuclease MutL [Christensenella sp.]
MNRICALDEAVYNRIAAGEVVVNPAAVVKELMENSMDAGATAITVEIADGGKGLIRVTDNGSGIVAEDIGLAVQKHATSKISSVEDLENIGTLGFRGEALSSMAAVSRLTISSRTKNSNEGATLTVSGEHAPDIVFAGLAEGTTVKVENLFYNIPARMKFLKNTARETVNVASVVSKLIFANPHISVKYISNDKTIYHSPGNGSLKDAVLAVYGKNMAHKVKEVDFAAGVIRLSGLISQPEFLYKSTNYMCFYLNNRYFQSKNLQAAVMRGFGERLLRGHYPFSVLHIDIPLDRADVNVHPNKLQVMLYEEADVLDAAEHAVRRTLNETSAPPTLDITNDIPHAEHFENPELPEFRSAQNLYNEQSKAAQVPNSVMTHDTTDSYIPTQNFENMIESVVKYNKVSEEQTFIEDVRKLTDYRIIGQVWSTYVVVECADCLYLIDQHAAHERINFERMKTEAAKGAVASQGLLVPYIATLPAEDFELLMRHAEVLKSLGFEIEEFGALTLKFNAFPAQIEKSSAEKLIEEVLYELRHTKNEILLLRDAIIRASCRYSIKAGYQLSDAQIEELLKEITELKAIPNCPHGRPIAVILKKSDLQKGFRRIV